eukprot:scaffold569_cov165-Amphora_coffeaeformis.AAC.11
MTCSLFSLLRVIAFVIHFPVRFSLHEPSRNENQIRHPPTQILPPANFAHPDSSASAKACQRGHCT